MNSNFSIRPSARKQYKMKMALQGPSGSGKTYSALQLAFGLCNDWSKICVIDTENGSADLYSHLGPYNVLSLTAPFEPERYIAALKTCQDAGMEVIILDSISHEWEGIGGILDIHGNMPGNSFANWAKVTPRHNSFVQAILQSSAHIIATIRTKQDYVLSEKNGKMVPEKVGLKGVTRDGMDYEFTLVFDLDMSHRAVASKDRTGEFSSIHPKPLGKEVGWTILQWCKHENTVVNGQNIVASAATNVQTLKSNYPNHFPNGRH